MASLLMLPNVVAMLMLMGVLGWLYRKHRDSSVRFWLLGLTFVLIETVSVAVYRGFVPWKMIAHVVALDAYVLAGVTFGWAAQEDFLPGHSQLPFFTLPAIPMLLLSTLYGLEVKANEPYIYTAILSLVVGLVYISLMPAKTLVRRMALVGVHTAIWLPITVLAMHGTMRWAIYWGLGCLYLLLAFSFRCRVRRGAIGGIVIVAGFAIWAACFFTHPVQATNPVLDKLIEQLWTMQKFVVILGMLLTLLEDATERLKLEAMHDPLTGLPNRRLFDDRLEQALERSMRSGMVTALFVVDLDGFKAINDTQGHKTGDLVLQAAAARLKSKVRTSDTLARCGGDEFCVIVNDLVRVEDCELIAEMLRGSLTSASGSRLTADLSGSVGYAMFPNDASDKDALYALADRAMYHDKRSRVEGKDAAVEGMPLIAAQVG